MLRSKSLLLSVLLCIACGDDSSVVDAGTDVSTADVSMDTSLDMAVDTASPDVPMDDVAVDTEMDAGGDVIEFTDPPIDPEVPVMFATTSYGEHGSQLMDIWLPEADEPTAVVVYYHGGGFVGGSRSSAHAGEARLLKGMLAAGIAWVSVDYRFVTDASSNGVIGCLSDSRRALQFVRYHAADLNIDTERVAVVGGSAGAGTSLWMAFHDDMADAESSDPVERMSTRVTTALVWETQATYDLMRWPTDVYSPTYPMTVESLLADTTNAFQVAAFYGLPLSLATTPDMLIAELETDAFVAYRADVDMLEWMSADDPPVYVYNSDDNIAPGASGFDLLHHPLHAMAVRARAEEVGLTIDANIPAFDVMPEAAGTIQYLTAQLE